MYSSTLVKILSNLNKNEWKAFDKFVRSPYFNSNKTILRFWEFLKKYGPTLDSPKLEKQKVYQKIFPNEAYKEKRMWQLMSDLKGLVEQFLVIESKEKNSIDYQMELRAIYSKRDLYEWFEQKSLALEKRLTNPENLELLNQFYIHQINDELYYNNQSYKTIARPKNLIAASTHLQAYYHIQQLKYATEWASRSLRCQEEAPLFVKSITYRSQLENNLLYSTYYDTFLLFTYDKNSKTISFEQLYATLNQHADKFPQKDKSILIQTLVNYGIRKFQLGAADLIPTLLNLYKLGLRENCLCYKGILHEGVFSNMVVFGSRLGQFEWLSSFLKDYGPLLDKVDRTKHLTWAKATIAFYKEEFEVALHTFDSVNFAGTKELSRRSVQIRACLECFLKDGSYYNLLKHKIQNFEKYLKRDIHLTSSKKEIFSRQNRFIRTLAKLIFENQSAQKFDAFYQEIAAIENLGNKTWLLNRIDKGKNRQLNQKTQTA